MEICVLTPLCDRMGNTVCMYQSGPVNVGNVGFYLLIWGIVPEIGLEEPCAPDVICSFLGINILPSLPHRFWICSSILWLWQNSRGWIPDRGREWGIIFRQAAQIFSLTAGVISVALLEGLNFLPSPRRSGFHFDCFALTSECFHVRRRLGEVLMGWVLVCHLSATLSYPESLPQPQYLSGHNVTAHEPNLLPPSLHAAFFAPFITCKGFLSPFPNLYNFYNNHSLQPVNTLLFVADWPGDNLDNYCGDHVIDSTALGWWVGDGIYFTAGKLSARMLPWGMKGISAAEFHGIYVFL